MDQDQAHEQSKQALITALRLLAASPKSRSELRKKLESKGFSSGSIEQALGKLQDQGVLDDAIYARDLVARLTLGKASGRHKIAFELKRHGIPKKLSDEILETLSPESERERALEQARLKWAGWSQLDPQKRKKRLYDLLIRKGYDFQIAQDILRELAKDPADDTL